MRTLILLLTSMLLIGCASLPEMNPEPLPPESPTEEIQYLPEGDFQMNESGNFFGDVYVRGDIIFENLPEAFCEQDCAMHEAVFINVLETGNESFAAFLEKNIANTYAAATPPRIMLGCLKDNHIEYSNHSDTYGMKEFEIPPQDTARILDAQEGNLVTLHLTKLPLSGGMGAPTCYSHFAEILVVD